MTFGGAIEKFHSDNSFYFGIQSAYTYDTLATSTPTRMATWPIRTGRSRRCTLANFQVKYLLQPGQTVPPFQPLDVWYTSGYVQDQWRLRANLTVTAGMRVDVPQVRPHRVRQPGCRRADVPRSGRIRPSSTTRRAAENDAVLVAPRRLQLGCDVRDGTTQVRGGTGLFTGKPPYVWISNQIGNTGVLYRIPR